MFKNIEPTPKSPDLQISQLLSDIEKKCSYVNTYESNNIKSVQKGILHIEVEKYLNSIYSPASIQKQEFNIVLTSKGSDGFGDVIWGVRAIQALKAVLPNAQFSIISNALDKFKIFIPPSSNIKLIEAKLHGRDFPDKDIGKNTLVECDLALDGPYIWNTEELAKIYDFDAGTLIESHRFIQGYEYDCSRYWPTWTEQIPEGQDHLTHTNELLHCSNIGKKIIIVTPDTLTQRDMMAVYKFSQLITMVTGDQSLSEGISASKQILYDPRKTDTLIWLINIAKRNGLALVAELFELCISRNDIDRMVEILSNPEYAQQSEILSSLCQQSDLSKALQYMTCRRLITNQHPDLKTLELKIHTLVENIFSSNKSEATTELVQQLQETNLDLIKSINMQHNPGAETTQQLTEYKG